MAATRRSAATLDRPLPARQQRSQATTEQLLSAAESLLREGGFDSATLRAIADRAGVSLGIVYRRFHDKDAVLRAVYTRFFERVAATNAQALEAAAVRLKRASLSQTTMSVVSGIAEGYRSQRALVRALILYARTHPDADFRKRAAALNAGAYHGLQRLFESQLSGSSLARREKAVRFAITAVAATLQEHIVFADSTARPEFSYADLVSEAATMMASYLEAACGTR